MCFLAIYTWICFLLHIVKKERDLRTGCHAQKSCYAHLHKMILYSAWRNRTGDQDCALSLDRNQPELARIPIPHGPLPLSVELKQVRSMHARGRRRLQPSPAAVVDDPRVSPSRSRHGDESQTARPFTTVVICELRVSGPIRLLNGPGYQKFGSTLGNYWGRT